MGNNIFQVLLSTIKSKITPIWTQFKMWTSPSFIKTKVITKIRIFFTEKLSVKPRHKKDYYTAFGWMISKRLAFAAVMVLGIASLYYLTMVNPIFAKGERGISTYSYKALPLRFAKGNVRIRARSGYIAYEGAVEKGAVNGEGTLYDPDGDVVYTGAFVSNKYNGYGKFYYDNSQLMYDGNFIENLFDGKGILYRRNGSTEYNGAFSRGMKDGEGVLYDTGNNQVYHGNFSKDQLVYSELLGKTTDEIAGSYTGKKSVYTDTDYFAVLLQDIDALYYGSTDENSLDDKVGVDGVYVMKSTIYLNGKGYDSIAELQEAFPAMGYQGNTEVLMPEAVLIKRLNDLGKTEFSPIGLETADLFQDVYQVDDYESDYYVYLYTFINEGIQYTFFCGQQHGGFGFYLMEKVE